MGNIDNPLIKQAIAVLNQNWTGTFTKPAPSLYPHQWNWDAGFIAIGLAYFNTDRAIAEMRHLFSGQWADGMLPHIVFGNDPQARYFPGPEFWQTEKAPHSSKNPLTSGITQPPVHAFALWRMFEIVLAKDKGKIIDFFKEIFPKVLASHRYLYEKRDPYEEGLVYIRHPWEPGTDNSPTWDKALAKMDVKALDIPPYQRKDLQNPKAALHRPTQEDYDRYVYLVNHFRKNNYDEESIFMDCPFLIQDPLFNAILIWSNECLIKIAAVVGEDYQQIIEWNERSMKGMITKLWNEETGLYDAWDIVNHERIKVQTNSGLMPLIAGVPTKEKAEKMVATLQSAMFSGTKENPVYLCPTYNLKAADINYEKYWRGPVWINMNWLLYQGLKRYDFDELAEQVRRDSLTLLEKYGFYEYFDPRRGVEGAAYGTHQFSWSAALCLDWLK